MRVARGDLGPSIEFFAIDSNGAALDELEDFAATYQRFHGGRPIGDPITITVDELAAANSTWSNGGYHYLANGAWRLDIPVAAVAVGTDSADRVVVVASATDATIVTPPVELYSEVSGWDPADIKAVLAAIVTRQVQVVGPPVPLDNANVLTLYRGDDYLDVDGTAVLFEGASPPADDLDLGNCTVYFVARESLASTEVMQVEAFEVVDNEDETVSVTFEFDHEATLSLAAGSYQYFERWVWSDGTVKTRQRGTLLMVEAWVID